MFMFVLSFYLYSMAVKDGCSMLTVERKATEQRNYAFELKSLLNQLNVP